jgi:hypothetical protein
MIASGHGNHDGRRDRLHARHGESIRRCHLDRSRSSVRQIIEIRLGPEGLEYLRECLTIGKALSHAVLDTLDLTSGVLTTFLPTGVPQEEILRFWSGGKLEEDAVYVERNSQTMHFGRIHTTDSIFLSLIHEHLKSDRAAFCVLEDQMARPTDPWLVDLPATKLIDGQSLYYVLTTPPADREAIERTFNGVTSFRPPHIGFLGRGSAATFFDRGHVAPHDRRFRDIAAATDEILIGAYDRESFVRWQRAPGDTRAHSG